MCRYQAERCWVRLCCRQAALYRRDMEVRDRDVRDGLSRVEGRGLVEAVVEGIEQSVIEAESAANGGFAIAPHIPRKSDTRLGKEDRPILAECGATDDRLRLKNAGDNRVVCRAASCLIPAVSRLKAETGT